MKREEDDRYRSRVMPNAKCKMLTAVFYMLHSTFCITGLCLRRPQQEAFVQTAGAITLEIERHVTVTGGFQLAHDGGADFRLERARHLVTADLDPRELVMVPHAKDPKAQLAQSLLGALDRSQLLAGHFGVIRNPRRKARRGRLVPGRQAGAVRQLANFVFGQIDIVERTAHAEFARRLPSGPVIRAVVGVVPVDDDRVAIGGVAVSAVLSSYSGLVGDAGRLLPSGHGPGGATGAQLLGEAAVVLTALALLASWLGEHGPRPRPVALALLPAIALIAAWKINGAVTGILVMWTAGLRLFLPVWLYALALWAFELDRGRERLRRAREVVSVGKISGPVGTYSNVDPRVEEYVCATLGLTPAPASSQVIQRDRHAEYVGALALVASSLDRFATEVRHLARTEVREVQEPFAEGQKGSSAMPHKRNPVVCERISGLARVIRGNLQAALEDVALWHERDISHSSVERVILPDSTMALDFMLNDLAWVMDGLVVHDERMLENLNTGGGLVFSQGVLLALIDAGLTRERAYAIVQEAAAGAWDAGGDFKEALRSEVTERIPQAEFEALFDPKRSLSNLDGVFHRLEKLEVSG